MGRCRVLLWCTGRWLLRWGCITYEPLLGDMRDEEISTELLRWQDLDMLDSTFTDLCKMYSKLAPTRAPRKSLFALGFLPPAEVQ